MATAVVLALCLSCKPKQGPGEASQSIRISAPAGESTKDLQAAPVENLAPLRSVSGGDDLVAAGRFEPSGTTFPAGITVTWPLAQTLTPGQTLWVIWLDETRKAWLGTGDTAVVDSSGRQASGTVRHFSTLGLSSREPARKQGQAGPSDERDDTRFTYVNVVRFGKGQAEVVDQARMEAVKKIYQDWAAKAGVDAPMPREKMVEIYQAGDFKTVKSLIEDGTIQTVKPDQEKVAGQKKVRNHSLDMADHRIVMCLEVLTDIAQKNGWKIYRSDSGNQTSGTKSDVDQTVYVYKKDANGNWVRSEADDARLVALFNEQFPKKTGLSVESLDIATIAGKDKFPDPRRTRVQLDAEGLRSVRLHAAETMEGLRKTPGAYTFCGAVVQQMQLRALDAIEQHLRIDPTKPGNEAGAREVHSDLRPVLGENGLNNLVCMEIGPGDDGTDVRPREVSRERAVEVMFDGLPPELRRGHAYDAAVANYLEFMHHVKDDVPVTKYHLRALDNGVQVLRQLEGKIGKVEYETLEAGEKRKAHLETLLGKDLAGSLILERWKAAFDVSVELRKAHKEGGLTQAELVKAFEPLARDMGLNEAQIQENLGRLRKEYDQRCQEFMLHNIIETSTQRVMEWMTYDAGDPPKRPDLTRTVDEMAMRRAMGMAGKEHDAKWQKIRQEIFQNHADLARLQLLYSFREMRPDVVKEIVALAERRGIQGEALDNLKGLVAESKSLFFGWNRYQEFKPLYHAYFAAVAAAKFAEYRKALKEHILIQAGFIDTDAGRQVTRLFKSGGLAKFESGVNTFFTKNKAAGVTSRYIRNAVFDFGNIDGVIQVLRAYSESGGDPNVTWAVMCREGVSALPIIGQFYSISQSPSMGDAAYNGAVMLVCIMVPQAGMAAMALSLSEAGVALYESEISAPLNNTVADALYRGYVGPSLYSFDKEPPRFEEADAAALKQAWEEAEKLKAAAGPEDQQRLAGQLIQVRRLQSKKVNWEAFEAEKRKRQTYEGSAILGTGAQFTQRRLAIPLPLDPVQPMIFYNPSIEGPVDFTVPALTAEQTQRFEQIRKMLNDDPNSIPEEACQEYDGLMIQKLRSERAQRYLEQARKNHELMHRIREDSLWPWISQRAPNRDMVDARAYMTKWCKENNAAVVAELKLQQVSVGDEIPAAAVEELGNRLLDDLTRSRQLWQSHEFLKQEQAKAREDQYQCRRGALAGEAIADAAVRPTNRFSPDTQAVLAEAGVDPNKSISTFFLGQAVEERHMPISPPEVEVSIRKVPLGSDEWEFRPDIRITADPTVYQPPYRAKLFQLDPVAAQAAVTAKKHEGLPLSDEAVQSIQAFLKKMGPIPKDLTHFTPLPLVFVFCDAVQIPDRVVPETVKDLPQLRKVLIPGEKDEAYLFGSAVAATEPEKLPSGPLEIRTIKMQKNPWNGIEITSQAMAQLDPNRPKQGLKFWIYRSQGANEPLQIFNKIFVHYTFGDTPIQAFALGPNEPYNTCRIAKDKFLILDHISTIHDMDQLPHKPYYYQIGQIPVIRTEDDEIKEKGKEVRSNVLEPDMEAEIQVTDARNEDGSIKATIDSEGWCNIGARLCLKCQQFDAWGAHFTFTANGWTGHAFSGRKEGDRFYGGGMFVSGYSAAAGCRMPIGPAGGSVSITAEGNGMSASASVTISADPQRIEEAARWAKGGKDHLAEYAAKKPKDANDYLARIKDDEYIKDRKPEKPGDYSDVSLWAEAMRRYIMRRFDYRMRIEYDYPTWEANAREQIAMASGDWQAVVQLRAKTIDLGMVKYEIETERNNAFAAVCEAFSACTNLSQQQKSSIENSRREVEMFRSSTERLPKAVRLAGYEWVSNAAYHAGDAGAYEQAQNERIKLMTAPEDKRFVGGVYSQMAQDLVTLTGDRNKSADLLDKAVQADIDYEPGKADQIRKRAESSRPAWWPEGK